MGEHSAPELPPKWRNYTKTIVAVVGAVGSALTPLAMGSGKIQGPEIIQAVVAFLTALGVFGFANKRQEK